MKFRSLSYTVEAFRFDPHGEHRLKLPDCIHGIPSPGADNWAYEGCVFGVKTASGQIANVGAGDWIVTDVDGVHHYALRPDDFRASYEPIEE